MTSDRDKLVRMSAELLKDVKNVTPGDELEHWLNWRHAPGSALYEDLAGLVKAGVRDGWAANVEVAGQHYRRSRILEPHPDTFYFSITAVLMRSETLLRGDYHGHPYGEINMVVPLDPDAQIAGPNGWRGAGWTAPAPGSRHYPEVRGGGVIALFYLPAGRISYDITPPAP